MQDEGHANEVLDSIAQELTQKYLVSPYSFSGEKNSNTFDIFSTFRYDPSHYTGPNNILEAIGEDPLDASFFFLLQRHVEKLQRAGEFFDFPISNLTVSKLLQHLTMALINADKLVAHRIKLIVSHDGIYNIEHAPLPTSHTLTIDVPDYDQFQKTTAIIPGYLEDWTGWTLYLDKMETLPSPFTSFKTTKRDVYNEARSRFEITPGDKREVLMHDNNGNVMEGSITSVAFWRQHKDPLTSEISFKWITPHLGIGCMDGVIRKWLLDEGKIIPGLIPVKELQDSEYVLLMNGLMGIKVAKLIL